MRANKVFKENYYLKLRIEADMAGFTQEQIADKIGTSRYTTNKCFVGKYDAASKWVFKICKLLDIDWKELVLPTYKGDVIE